MPPHQAPRGSSGSSTSESSQNISQHIKKFYCLLCDGGLNLPPFESVHFGKIVIGSKKRSSFSSVSSLRVKDAMILRRHIEKEVARRTKTDIENFCFALKSMIEDEYFFCLCLVPFESTNEGGGTYFSSNESFFKLLLNISTIQVNIMDILFEELLSKCQEYEEETYEQWDRNIPKLIISQMRWLDMISDSKKVTEHLETILQVSSVEFSKELISAIPEIIDDSEHDHIVDKLDQVMQDKTEMTTCVIDALSNLNLKKEIMDETTERVLRNLNSANTNDLPVIIRFLLQSTNDDNIKNVVEGIRKDLDISSITFNDDDDGTVTNTQQHGDNNDDEDELAIQLSYSQKRSHQKKGKVSSTQTFQCESLIVSAIATGIRHRKIIEKSFIQTISSTDEDHTIVDLWILFIIYSMPNHRKDAEQVLKRKIKSRKIDSTLLKLSIEGHGEALEQIFSSLNDLASSLLRNSTDYIISLFGQEMYSCLFNSFKTDYNRQKIIQSLITHVGSSTKNEKDAALDVLLMIASCKLSLLRNYSTFFQVLIDCLTNLTDQQLRKVYKLFSMLAYTKTFEKNKNTGNNTRDELMIIIRKQLSNTNITFKKMGIIGACSILSMIGSKSVDYYSSNPASEVSTLRKQELTTEEFDHAIELLDFALKCCFKVPNFKTLLYDELCFIVLERSLDERLLQEIQTRLIHDFFQRCIIEKSDFKKLKSPNKRLEYKIQYSLDENNTQYVNMLPLLDNNSNINNNNNREDSHESLWNLFSQFRLMKIVMDKLESDYADFLLDSGIVLFDLEEVVLNFKDFTRNEKDLICLSLFFAINWFRELLNGFKNQDKFNNRLLERIETLNVLEKSLDLCLSMNQSFHLPQFNLLIPQHTGTVAATSDNSSGGKKTKSKKKKLDDQDDDEQDEKKDETDLEDEEKMTSSTGKKTSDKYLSIPSKRKYLSNLKMHYRELDLTSSINVIIANSTSSTGDDNDTSNVKPIQPTHLYYLIDDLCSKLKSVLSKSKVSFFVSKEKENHYNLGRISSSEFFKQVFNVLPYLYKQIKIISKESLIDNDDNMDDDDNSTMNGDFITPCFQLLTDIILKILEHFKDPNDFVRIISIMLNGSTVNSTINDENNNDVLRNISDDIDNPEELCETFYNSIKELILEMNSFEICYKLFELLKSIVDITSISSLRVDLQGLSKHLLQTPFSSIKSEALGNMITGLISYGSWITGMNELVECLKEKLNDDQQEDQHQHLDINFPNITKLTLPICIKKVFVELSNRLVKFDLVNNEEIQKNLKKVHQVITYYKHLTVLTMSTKCTPQLLQSTLVGAKLLLGNFLKLVRYLGKHLKSNKEIVIKIFTNLNRANRQVQTICIDRKLSLNKSLAKIIPKVKKDLESCNWKTKVILKQNGVENAITISVIKERDVTGKETTSQHFYSQLIVDKRKRKMDDEDEEEDQDEKEDESIEEQPKKKRKKKKSTEEDQDENEGEIEEKPAKKKRKKKKPTEENDEQSDDGEKKKKKRKKKDKDEDEPEKKKKRKKKDKSEKPKKKKKHNDEAEPTMLSDHDGEISPSKNQLHDLILEESLAADTLVQEDDDDDQIDDIFKQHDSLEDFIDFGNSKRVSMDDESSNHSNYDVTKSMTEDDFVDDEAEEVEEGDEEEDEQDDDDE